MNVAVKSAGLVLLGAALAEAFVPAGLVLASPSARIARSAPSLRDTLRRPAVAQLRAHVDPASAFHVLDTLQVIRLSMSIVTVFWQQCLIFFRMGGRMHVGAHDIAISKGKSSTERLMQRATWYFDDMLGWCRQELPLRRKQQKSWRTPTSLAQEDMLR